MQSEQRGKECRLTSALSTEIHLERTLRIKMVDQVVVFSGLTKSVFSLVEHRLCCVKIEHAICHHPALNKSNPAMQFGGGPFFRMLQDCLAHPAQVFGLK